MLRFYAVQVKQWNIVAGIACELMRTLFKHVEINQQSTEVRFAFYQLVGVLLQQHLTTFQEMKHNFVRGFLQMVEGEKDPRCLLITFRLHQLVTQHFSLTPFVEEMFEVVCCYFPISYNPVRNHVLLIAIVIN
jgi:DNA repair/transcription protein MET18/MMS19